ENYSAYAYLGQQGVEPAVRALVAENERARRFGFTAAELERIKKIMLKSVERSYNERDKTESTRLAAEIIRHFLDDEPIPGIENEYRYYQQLIEGITLEDVNTYVAATIPAPTAAKLVILTGPEKADFPIPTEEHLLDMVEAAAEQEITPYEEETVAGALMTQPPAPGKIISAQKNDKLDLTTFKLQNGVNVIVKSTDFKNDQVILTASRFGGQYRYDPAERIDAEYASTLVAQ